MKLMFELTVQHLIQNKRKTFVTLIATTLSVTMLTAIIVAATSGYAFLKEDSKLAYGNYHLLYYDVPVENLYYLTEHETTESVSLGYQLGFAKNELSTERSLPYLYVEALDFEKPTHRPVSLIEGRLPQTSNELIVSEDYLKSLSKEVTIGDELEVILGERHSKDKESEYDLGLYDQYEPENEQFVGRKRTTFEIVGIMETPVIQYPHINTGSFAFTMVDDYVISKYNDVDAAVIVTDRDRAHQVGVFLARQMKMRLFEGENPEHIRSYNIDINSSVLQFEGDLYQQSKFKLILWFAVFLTLIVIVTSVHIIRNSFELSLAARRKHLGILSSVGVTKRQKRHAILIEALIIGVISIPIGLLLGIGGLSIAFSIVTKVMTDLTVFDFALPLTVKVIPSAVLLVMILVGITIYLSALSPAKKAGRISAIECIKQAPEYSVSSKPIKISSMITRLFGIEGELALKTIKSQKRQYRTTVTGLTFTFVTFLVVCHAIALGGETFDFVTENNVYDISIQNCEDELIKEIVKLPSVESYQIQQDVGGIYYFDTLPDQMHNYDKYLLLEESYTYLGLDVVALDDETFKSYLEQLGEPTDELNVFVLYNQYVSAKGLNGYVHEQLFKVEENMTLNTEISVLDKEIGEYVNKEITLPIDIFATKVPQGRGEYQTVFTSFSHLKALKESDESWDKILQYRDVTLTVQSNDPLAFDSDFEKLTDKILFEGYYLNYGVYGKQGDLVQTIIEIFAVGFVVLMFSLTLINIFNNITNSIMFRKKEFSALISIGMTEKSVQKMVVLESAMYVFKALVYGLPIAFGLMFGMTTVVRMFYLIPYTTLPYSGIVILVLILSGFTLITSWYSIRQLKGLNLIESLRNENI